MASRKPFLIRVAPELLERFRAWAEQEMRSVNGQIEWALRDALRRHARLAHDETERDSAADEPGDEERDAGGPQ
ncbi:MAG: Arc family DNA binding domain-containing protein [Planctomycetes bacterium]|nr:Arc family DNA binding domain-containing protein [Planctomycetota bacterium]